MEKKYIPTKAEMYKLKFKKGYLQLSGDKVFHSIQGEGPFIGMPCTFIRLNKCNLRCDFCDTKYTFEKYTKEYYEAENYTPEEVIQLIEEERDKKGVDRSDDLNIVITGGEPLLQSNGIEELLCELPAEASVHIETNGTIMPSKKILDECYIVCSPKLKSSGNNFKYNHEVITKLSKGNTVFKFVCSTEEDIEEVMDFIEEYNIYKDTVYIMPEGVTMEDNHKSFQKIIKKVLEYGLMVTPRLQNIIWDGYTRKV